MRARRTTESPFRIAFPSPSPPTWSPASIREKIQGLSRWPAEGRSIPETNPREIIMQPGEALKRTMARQDLSREETEDYLSLRR